MSRSRRRGLAAAAAAAVLLLWSAGPAAATTGRIDSAEGTAAGTLSIVFSAVDLPAGETIDEESVQVSINGQLVPTAVTPIGDAAELPVRTTFLVMDTSGSMNNPTPDGVSRLVAAKRAADAYLRSVPGDVQVGLITFADSAAVRVAPTTDRGSVRRAVDGLTADGDTALYDAVVLASQELPADGVRSQIVLSDGEDTSSSIGLPRATAAVADSGASLDAIALGAEAAANEALVRLADAGNGSVTRAANAEQLSDRFEQQAQQQASQLLIEAEVPADVAGTTQNVVVGARAGTQTIGAEAAFPLPAVPSTAPEVTESFGPKPVAAPEPGITSQPWFLPAAIAAVALGLGTLLVVAFLSTDKDAQTSGRVRRRLARYSLNPRPEERASTVATSGALGQSQVARSAVELAGKVVQGRDLDTGLAAKLDAAGVPLRPAEWMLVHIGFAIAVGLTLTLLSGFSLLATVLGVVLGVGLPYAFLSIKEGRRKSAFAQQLPDTLQLLSGSLAAGYSLPQAVDTVVRESSGPMAVELNRAIVEARLGVPIEDALETVARRMNSVDFAWVVMAIKIQRDVGGNLAEVLSNVAATMRERERLRRQVEVLSAEGRLSAIILGALPVVFALYLALTRPEYLAYLVTTPLGILMVVGGVVLLLGGAFWLSKVVKVEV
jgi:tight adherence protein B